MREKPTRRSIGAVQNIADAVALAPFGVQGLGRRLRVIRVRFRIRLGVFAVAGGLKNRWCLSWRGALSRLIGGASRVRMANLAKERH